jgi:hypothetical protein
MKPRLIFASASGELSLAGHQIACRPQYLYAGLKDKRKRLMQASQVDAGFKAIHAGRAS